MYGDKKNEYQISKNLNTYRQNMLSILHNETCQPAPLPYPFDTVIFKECEISYKQMYGAMTGIFKNKNQNIIPIKQEYEIVFNIKGLNNQEGSYGLLDVASFIKNSKKKNSGPIENNEIFWLHFHDRLLAIKNYNHPKKALYTSDHGKMQDVINYFLPLSDTKLIGLLYKRVLAYSNKLLMLIRGRILNKGAKISEVKQKLESCAEISKFFKEKNIFLNGVDHEPIFVAIEKLKETIQKDIIDKGDLACIIKNFPKCHFPLNSPQGEEQVPGTDFFKEIWDVNVMKELFSKNAVLDLIDVKSSYHDSLGAAYHEFHASLIKHLENDCDNKKAKDLIQQMRSLLDSKIVLNEDQKNIPEFLYALCVTFTVSENIRYDMAFVYLLMSLDLMEFYYNNTNNMWKWSWETMLVHINENNQNQKLLYSIGGWHPMCNLGSAKIHNNDFSTEGRFYSELKEYAILSAWTAGCLNNYDSNSTPDILDFIKQKYEQRLDNCEKMELNYDENINMFLGGF